MNKRPVDKAWVCGFTVALAEMHRRQMNSTAVCEVARDAGIGIKLARNCGVAPFDLRELTKAGVPW